MPKLEAHLVPVDKFPELCVLTLKGGLDLASLPELEARLAQLKKEGRLKVVVDLEGLNFISSTGLGAFLGTVNHFRTGGGDLAFVSLSPKIQRIFEMVGFHKVLTMLPGITDGLNHFKARQPGPASAFLLEAETTQPHSGERFHILVKAVDADGRVAESYSGWALLRPGTGIVSPSKVGPFVAGVWTGSVILTGPGPVHLQIVEAELSGALDLQVQEHKSLAVFPLQVACPGCHCPLEAASSNVYRCLDCSSVLLVDRWGHVISLRQNGTPPAAPALVHQLLVPADVNILPHLRSYVVGLLKEQRYPESRVDDVELAFDEALSNVIEHACEFDAGRSVALRLALSRDSVELTLRDNGNPFNPRQAQPLDIDSHLQARKSGGLGRYLMEKLMDQIEYSSGPDGNSLRMVKNMQGSAVGGQLQRV